MEQEILSALKNIRFLLYVFITLFGIFTFLWVINGVSAIRKNFGNAKEDTFIDEADKYFESANYKKLVKLCKEKLEKYPNHSNATWWLARAYLELGNKSEAKMLLEKILELEPRWEKSLTEPYLNKISNE